MQTSIVDLKKKRGKLTDDRGTEKTGAQKKKKCKNQEGGHQKDVGREKKSQ